jgi:hypothetical protein
MAQAGKSHARERARQREAMAKFIAYHGVNIWAQRGIDGDWVCRSHPLYASTLEYVGYSTKEEAELQIPFFRHMAGLQIMAGRGRFNVASVRSAAEKLIAHEASWEVFRDWTRDRGLGPETRIRGAFCKPYIKDLSSKHVSAKLRNGLSSLGGWPGHLAAAYEAQGLGSASVSQAPALAKFGRRILREIEGQPSECLNCNGTGMDIVGAQCLVCIGSGQNCRGHIDRIAWFSQQLLRRGKDAYKRNGIVNGHTKHTRGSKCWMMNLGLDRVAAAHFEAKRTVLDRPRSRSSLAIISEFERAIAEGRDSRVKTHVIVSGTTRVSEKEIDKLRLSDSVRSIGIIEHDGNGDHYISTEYDAHVRAWTRLKWPAYVRGELLQEARRERIWRRKGDGSAVSDGRLTDVVWGGVRTRRIGLDR